MRKIFFTVLMIFSASSFAAEKGSVDSFLSVLPLGQYRGFDESGDQCSIIVSEVNFPDKAILITGISYNNKVTKMIDEGSDYFLKSYNKEFIQTIRYYVDTHKNDYYEKIVRTQKAGDNLLYVVTAVETNVLKKLIIEKVECIVRTKL